MAVAEPLPPRDARFFDGEAKIELFECSEEIAAKIRGYSHVILVTYPRGGGVASASVAKVVGVEGRVIRVKMNLDGCVDVLGVQPYCVATDCVYGASTPTEVSVFREAPKIRMLRSMLKEAENFHGDLCAGVAIGVRMLYRASSELGCHPRDGGLKAEAAVKGCVADGIQGPMGATNKRFRALEHVDDTATFTYKEWCVKLRLAQSKKFCTAEEVLEAEEDDVIGGVQMFRNLGPYSPAP